MSCVDEERWYWSFRGVYFRRGFARLIVGSRGWVLLALSVVGVSSGFHLLVGPLSESSELEDADLSR